MHEFSYSDIRHGFEKKWYVTFPMEPPAGKNFWNAIYDFTGRADGANWCHGVISWMAMAGKSVVCDAFSGKIIGKS